MEAVEADKRHKIMGWGHEELWLIRSEPSLTLKEVLEDNSSVAKDMYSEVKGQNHFIRKQLPSSKQNQIS